MNNEQYLNSFTYIEFYAMLLREVLRLVSIKNRYDEKKFVIEITSKLKFQKETDFRLFEACIDILEDTELAINEVKKNGLITKSDYFGEMYLRLYGVLNAFYQQMGAIIDLMRLFNLTNQRYLINHLKNLKIIELRNKLASHTTKYSLTNSKNENDFFRLAQSTICKRGNNLLVVGKDSSETIDINPMMEEFNVEEDALRQLIEELIAPSEVLVTEKAPEYSPRAMRVLEKSVQEAENQKEAQAGTEHLLVAMLKETDCVATRLLYTMGVNIQKLYVAVLTAMGIENPTAEELQGGRNQKTQKSGAATPTLDQYSRDLTVMAAEGKLDPVVGRDREITRLIQDRKSVV